MTLLIILCDLSLHIVFYNEDLHNEDNYSGIMSIRLRVYSISRLTPYFLPKAFIALYLVFNKYSIIRFFCLCEVEMLFLGHRKAKPMA